MSHFGPDELWVPDGPSAFVWPESVEPKHGLTCRACEGDIATCGCWDDDPLECSAAVSPPAADNTRCAAAASIDGDPFLCCRDTGHAGPHNNPYQKASWIDAGADEVTAAELFAVEQAADNTTDCGCGSNDRCPDRVRAQMDEDTAATDGTDLYDAIVALFDYHDITRNLTADYLWRCGGCNWKGNQRREHTLHRLALVADMKNATHRIQEQLGGTS